jgi:holliday junction DNA helicase RuvA
MIGKLRGRIDEVGGVGYSVEVGTRLASTLERGSQAVLFIETVVREDAIRLFGFASADEKAWFRLLQDVQGVGAKTALAVLSALSVAELIAAIATQDSHAVSRAHGIGAKLAKRIVMELKDKAPALPIVVGAPQHISLREPGVRADAISALVNLGYAQMQASGAVDRGLARLGEEARVEELIREGLKALS